MFSYVAAEIAVEDQLNVISCNPWNPEWHKTAITLKILRQPIYLFRFPRITIRKTIAIIITILRAEKQTRAPIDLVIVEDQSLGNPLAIGLSFGASGAFRHIFSGECPVDNLSWRFRLEEIYGTDRTTDCRGRVVRKFDRAGNKVVEMLRLPA